MCNIKNAVEDIVLLLFADDVTIVDDTVIGLQKKLDALSVYCKKWGLELNMDKSQIIFF